MGEKMDRLRRFLHDIFAGLTYFEIEQTAKHEKFSRQDLFLLVTFGNFLGVPILPSYYSLRILPLILPAIDSWKNRMLKERDLTEIKSL